MIVGVDEAGRGPLAGPVVAAAVILCTPRPAGLDDSKKLSGTRRAELEAVIKRRCRWAVGIADVEEIDRLNIFGATMLAMTRAVAALSVEEIVEVRVDGNLTPGGSRSRLVLACACDRRGRCDRTLHFGGKHHRQGTPRPHDARRSAGPSALRLVDQHGLWNRHPP